jgi:predicted small integral membrane protein
MSTSLLWDTDAVIIGVCVNYVSNWIGKGLFVINLFPWILTIMAFTASRVRREFSLFVLGVASSMNIFLNWALRWIIQQPPPIPGCGETYEMPALATQHSIFITMLLLFGMAAWNVYVSEENLVIAFAFLAVTTFARVYIGFNTAAQLIVGACVGVVHALLWMSLFYYLIVPRIAWFLSHWPFTYMRYVDTICVHRPYRRFMPASHRDANNNDDGDHRTTRRRPVSIIGVYAHAPLHRQP